MSSRPTALLVLAVWLAASACERPPAAASEAASPQGVSQAEADRILREKREAENRERIAAEIREIEYRNTHPRRETPPEIAALQRRCPMREKMGELCSIHLENAEADAARALKKGDTRVLGIYGYSVSFPGISPDDWEKHHGAYRGIEGTTDAMYGDDHWTLISYATDYAAIYNMFILKNRPNP